MADGEGLEVVPRSRDAKNISFDLNHRPESHLDAESQRRSAAGVPLVALRL